MDSNPLYTGIIRTMTGERGFPKDPITAEDEVYFRLGELVEENAITEAEGMECWTQYIQSVRPDVRVTHLGETVARPFYE